MSHEACIAFDLGAESGRAMVAWSAEGRLQLEEVHRFPNVPQHLPSGYHWNLQAIYANLLEGMSKASAFAASHHLRIVSVGVDTWGVDFGLVGASGQLLGLPFAYRDASHAPAMQRVSEQLGERALYDATGIQFMPFNTLFQLVARRDAEPRVVDAADRMLHMPDLLNYLLSGEAANEATICSTSQMIDPRTQQWDLSLLERLSLPTRLLGRIIPAGTVLGPLRREVAEQARLDASVVVIAVGGHDTASAIAAVPVLPSSGNWAYISSGTWSLMGVELDKPRITDTGRAAGFTNERGVGGKVRYLTNISGLWLVQEVRRDLERMGQSIDYPALSLLASQSEPMRTLIDPAHAPFASPGGMMSKLEAYARQTRQPIPATPGQAVRCCLESLALTYRRVLRGMETELGTPIDTLHVVGGGGKNTLLQQMTADAIERPVIVGPYEATAIGNALVQGMAREQIADLAALRAVVRSSCEVTTYQPGDTAPFAAAVDRFAALCRG